MYHINDLMLEYYQAIAGAKGGSLMTAGAVGAAVNTKGCNEYHVIVENLNGSDVLQIQGRIADSGWQNIQAAITSNTEVTFSGLWDEVQITRTSGTGTTTKVTMRAGR